MTDTLRFSRRNLILISLAISVFYAAELSFTGVSFLGLEVKSGRPGVLPGFIWIAWLYFVVRYLTFYLESGARQQVDEALDCAKAFFIAMEQLKNRLDEAKGRNNAEDFKSAKIELIEYKVNGRSKDHLDISYKGRIVRETAMEVGTAENHTSFSSSWGVLFRIRAYSRSVLQKPAILEYLAPFYIAALPVIIWLISCVVRFLETLQCAEKSLSTNCLFF